MSENLMPKMLYRYEPNGGRCQKHTKKEGRDTLIPATETGQDLIYDNDDKKRVKEEAKNEKVEEGTKEHLSSYFIKITVL